MNDVPVASRQSTRGGGHVRYAEQAAVSAGGGPTRGSTTGPAQHAPATRVRWASSAREAATSGCSFATRLLGLAGLALESPNADIAGPLAGAESRPPRTGTGAFARTHPDPLRVSPVGGRRDDAERGQYHRRCHDRGQQQHHWQSDARSARELPLRGLPRNGCRATYEQCNRRRRRVDTGIGSRVQCPRLDGKVAVTTGLGIGSILVERFCDRGDAGCSRAAVGCRLADNSRTR